MDHQRLLHQLQYYLERDDSPWILTLIDHIFVHQIPDLSYLAVTTVIKHGARSAYYSLYLLQIGKFIPHDDFRQERVEILAFIPHFFKQNLSVLHIVASYVSCIILENDPVRYKRYKSQFGDFLIKFPQTASSNRHDGFINDRERIEILRYLEKYVKPEWSDESTTVVGETFSILAKRLQSHNREDFMETILESNCYTYHGMMTALTSSVDSGVLTTEPCIGFMIAKVDKVDLPAVGIVDDNLKLIIEEQFVLALLKPLNVFGIDRFLSHLAKNEVIQPLALERAVKKHVLKVFSVLLDKPEHNSLIYMTRLCALSRFCPSEKNAILKMLIEFATEYVDRMSCFQANVLCSTLATLSYPKRDCEVKGSDKLFDFLFERLISMMPVLGKTEAEVDVLAYQNVLVSLYNLYSFDARENQSMRNIDRRWRDKILHASDLHIVTSRNVQAEIERASKIGWRHSSVMDGLLRLQNAIVNNGQVFHYILGNARNIDLVIELPHVSDKQYFEDDSYTGSWAGSLVNLTRVPKGDGPPLSIPDVRKFSAEEETSDEDEDDEEEENEYEEMKTTGDKDEKVEGDSKVCSTADASVKNDDGDNESNDDEDESSNAQREGSEVSETAENLSDSGLGDCSADSTGSLDLEKSSDSEENPDEELEKKTEKEAAWSWDYAVFTGAIRRGAEENVGTEYSVGSDDDDSIGLVENSWFRIRNEADYDLYDALNDERDRRWTRAFSHNDGTFAHLQLAEGMLVQEVHSFFEGFLRTTFNIPLPANQNNDPPAANDAPPRVKDPERCLIIED